MRELISLFEPFRAKRGPFSQRCCQPNLRFSQRATFTKNDDSEHCALLDGGGWPTEPTPDRLDFEVGKIHEKSTIPRSLFCSSMGKHMRGAACGVKSFSVSDLPLPIFKPNDALASGIAVDHDATAAHVGGGNGGGGGGVSPTPLSFFPFASVTTTTTRGTPTRWSQ